ncbi:MAG: PaaI family thioesterase [SAR202 cluster bacterium]|nr:PaaI family thioesterase [SAR202 cluster bacterium]
MTTPAGQGRSPVSLDAFEKAMNDRFRGTMMELVGCRVIKAEPGKVMLEMPFRAQLRQLTGLFHTGALLTLADTAATAASLSLLPEAAQGDLSTFSFSVQLSANLIANASEGTVNAEAVAVHRGRTTHVVETRVTDAKGRLLVLTTTTHLIMPSSR